MLREIPPCPQRVSAHSALETTALPGVVLAGVVAVRGQLVLRLRGQWVARVVRVFQFRLLVLLFITAVVAVVQVMVVQVVQVAQVVAVQVRCKELLGMSALRILAEVQGLATSLAPMAVLDMSL